MRAETVKDYYTCVNNEPRLHRRHSLYHKIFPQIFGGLRGNPYICTII